MQCDVARASCARVTGGSSTLGQVARHARATFCSPLVVSDLDPDYIFWIVIVTMITGPVVRLYDTQKPWFS
jgi:hypothetical protein